MRRSVFIGAFIAAMSVSYGEAAIRVTFVNPERYRDEDFRSAWKREGIINEFRKFFDRLGTQYLKPDETLGVEVLDIDLAGAYEPWRGAFSDVRVLRDITPPSFKLRYRLTKGKRILASGEETVTDMNYLSDLSARSSSERFAYEKDMLRDWFRRRFATRAE